MQHYDIVRLEPDGRFVGLASLRKLFELAVNYAELVEAEGVIGPELRYASECIFCFLEVAVLV
jgi:hypothetical protein